MPHPRRRSAARTDNAFSAILDASRRGVSTGSISATFGDAFSRSRPQPVTGGPVSRAPENRFTSAPGATGTPGRTLGPESLIGRQIQPSGLADSRANVEIGNPGVPRPRLPLNELRQVRQPGRLISGAEQKRNARSRPNRSAVLQTRRRQNKAQEKLRRQAFVKAGGQQAVDRSFAAAGGTKTFNARTGKRSVSIADPRGEGRKRVEFGSIQVRFGADSRRPRSPSRIRTSTNPRSARSALRRGARRRR